MTARWIFVVVLCGLWSTQAVAKSRKDTIVIATIPLTGGGAFEVQRVECDGRFSPRCAVRVHLVRPGQTTLAGETTYISMPGGKIEAFNGNNTKGWMISSTPAQRKAQAAEGMDEEIDCGATLMQARPFQISRTEIGLLLESDKYCGEEPTRAFELFVVKENKLSNVLPSDLGTDPPRGYPMISDFNADGSEDLFYRTYETDKPSQAFLLTWHAESHTMKAQPGHLWAVVVAAETPGKNDDLGAKQKELSARCPAVKSARVFSHSDLRKLNPRSAALLLLAPERKQADDLSQRVQQCGLSKPPVMQAE